jgi:hypothetical protein
MGDIGGETLIYWRLRVDSNTRPFTPQPKPLLRYRKTGERLSSRNLGYDIIELILDPQVES